MSKYSFIFGTRPEAIKLCPLILKMRQEAEFQVEVCVTGQHRQMLDSVLKIFGIVPDVDLNLMKERQTLASLTAAAITGINNYLEKSHPDAVIVQGDTTTVFAAALSAYYNKIKIIHVEAGLRTGKLYSPWPEEGNRILSGHLADIHFCPTEKSRNNLLREGIADSKICVTGNTVIDALLLAQEINSKNLPAINGLPSDLQPGCCGRDMILVTGHRRENFGNGFQNLCQALIDIAKRHPDVAIVYPVHLNPNVRDIVFAELGGGKYSNIILLEPLEYLPFVALMERAKIILTDSGGVQEEAPGLGKPVLVTRDTTERPEAVEAGTVKLVGTDIDSIVSNIEILLTDENAYSHMSGATNPYGDGKASEKIISHLKKTQRRQ